MIKTNRFPTKFNRSGTRSGSIMLDVVFALWACIIAFLPIAALLVASQLTDREAQIQTVATNEAEMEMETLRSQSFANTQAMTAGSFAIPASLTSAYPTVSMAGNYNISSVAGLGDVAHPVIQIAVMVKWSRPDTKAGTFSSVRVDSYETSGATS